MFYAEVLRIIFSVQSTDKIPLISNTVEELKTDPGILIQLKSSVIKTHYTVVNFFFFLLEVCFLNRHDKQL